MSTVVHSRPDAVIMTDRGPAFVYAAGSGHDGRPAAIVGEGFELTIPDSEVEHLARAIAPNLELVDPDDDTETVSVESLRDDVGDTARSLHRAILIATRQLKNPDEWTVEQLPGVASVVSDLLETLTDLQYELESLAS